MGEMWYYGYNGRGCLTEALKNMTMTIVSAIGWYCLVNAGLQTVALIYTTNNTGDDNYKLRRSITWVSNSLFIIAAILCFR